MGYEYQIIFAYNNRKRLEEEINKLGQDGWELVGGEKGYLYFKRQVMENETEIKRIYSGESNQSSTNNTSIRSRIGSVVYRIKVITKCGLILDRIRWHFKICNNHA